MKELQIANKMQEFKEFFIALDKDMFLDSVEQYRPLIYGIMESQKEDNMIRAMLPSLKDMSQKGIDPSLPIAVMAYLLETPKKLQTPLDKVIHV